MIVQLQQRVILLGTPKSPTWIVPMSKLTGYPVTSLLGRCTFSNVINSAELMKIVQLSTKTATIQH